ncbi:MAG: hypothetical protein JNJ84_01915 [Rhodobacteraceae bacterium]|nr:hypothetical protein [Paracoccaceae bacterium]
MIIKRSDHTYDEDLFDSLYKGPSWRKEIKTGNVALDEIFNGLTENTVRVAMLSFGREALARHIDAGGYLGSMLRDFLVRDLRGEKNLLPRGNKRTDAQVQREIIQVYKIFSMMMLDGLSRHAAISNLIEQEPHLNRKQLERLAQSASKRSRWGIAGLWSHVMERAARRLASEICKNFQAPYIPPVFGGKSVGIPRVTFGGIRLDPKGTKPGCRNPPQAPRAGYHRHGEHMAV